MEEEEKRLQEKIGVLDAKLVVQELQEKVKVKSEAINQLRNKVKELETRLKTREAPAKESNEIVMPKEEKPQRAFF